MTRCPRKKNAGTCTCRCVTEAMGFKDAIYKRRRRRTRNGGFRSACTEEDGRRERACLFKVCEGDNVRWFQLCSLACEWALAVSKSRWRLFVCDALYSLEPARHIKARGDELNVSMLRFRLGIARRMRVIVRLWGET